MPRHSRTIRKITLGLNPLREGLAFALGSSAGKKGSGYTITAIREDDQNHLEYGITRYIVYIKKEQGPEAVWKTFERVPVLIEYMTPDEEVDPIYVG